MATETPLSEATSGAIGAALANTIVFPLDVVKTRLQVQTKVLTNHNDNPDVVIPSLKKKKNQIVAYKSPLDAILKIIKKEGIQGLYAGLGSGLAGTVVSSFSYFYIYSTIRTNYQAKIGAGVSISTPMELTLGAVAGALCQFIVLPIGIVTTRQQTFQPDSSPSSPSLPVPGRLSFIDTLKTIIKEEGFTELWKGLRASLVLCSNPAITYGMFERVKSIWIKKSGGKPLTSGQVFIIGALSKTLATVVTYPYIMAKVRMQWKAPKSTLKNLTQRERDLIVYKSAVDILYKVYQTDGLKGWYSVRYYEGMSAQILKAVLCQAIIFTLKEKLSKSTASFFAFLSGTKSPLALK